MLTKEDVKDLCESDNKLQWWAMVLFAEICAVVNGGHDDQEIGRYARAKVDEFPRMVVQRVLEKAREQAEASE